MQSGQWAQIPSPGKLPCEAPAVATLADRAGEEEQRGRATPVPHAQLAANFCGHGLKHILAVSDLKRNLAGTAKLRFKLHVA